MYYKIKFSNNNGFFILNKPNKLTSNQVIQNIRKYSSCVKIGHAGTLDPTASGVLFISIGFNAILNQIINKCKRYLVFIILGVESDSVDFAGKILYFNHFFFDIDKNIIKFFLFFLKKNIKQIPPNYSAVKHNGKKLYTYARLGINIKVKKKFIFINKINFVNIFENILVLDVECSKGTYIRDLVRTFSMKVKYPMSVYKIIRLKVSSYNIIDAYNFF